MRRGCRWCGKVWITPGRDTGPGPYFCPDCEDKEEIWYKIVTKGREYAENTVSGTEPVRGSPQAVEPHGEDNEGNEGNKG